MKDGLRKKAEDLLRDRKKMYEDYECCRDVSNDNPLITCFLSNEYYAEEAATNNNSSYMKEFQGSCDGIDSTAASKSLIFTMEPDEDAERWKSREPKNWSNSDVLHWIASVAEHYKFPYEYVNEKAFNIDGEKLLSMTKKDFVSVDGKYGLSLFKALRKWYLHAEEEIETPFHETQTGKREVKLETLSTPAKIPEELLPLTSTALKRTPSYGLVSPPGAFHNDIANSSEPYPFELDPIASNKSNSAVNINENSNSNVDGSESSGSETKNSTDVSLGSDTEHSDSEFQKQKKKCGKRPPGRPPGVKTNKEKPEKKTGRLWEFIRDLLLDPQHCPSVICWENYDDGVFRFVKSEKVAKIWGDRKGNEKMNYEKLSRAMRYYYRSKVLQPVIGRRLVYKFGPTARGWKTENPNFRH